MFVPQSSIFTPTSTRKLFWAFDYQYTCPLCVRESTSTQDGVRGLLTDSAKATKWAEVCRVILINLILDETPLPSDKGDESSSDFYTSDPAMASDGKGKVRSFFTRREIETVVEANWKLFKGHLVPSKFWGQDLTTCMKKKETDGEKWFHSLKPAGWEGSEMGPKFLYFSLKPSGLPDNVALPDRLFRIAPFDEKFRGGGVDVDTLIKEGKVDIINADGTRTVTEVPPGVEPSPTEAAPRPPLQATMAGFDPARLQVTTTTTMMETTTEPVQKPLPKVPPQAPAPHVLGSEWKVGDVVWAFARHGLASSSPWPCEVAEIFDTPPTIGSVPIGGVFIKCKPLKTPSKHISARR